MLLIAFNQVAVAVALLGLLLSISILIPIVLCIAVLPRVFVRSYYARRMFERLMGSIESRQLAHHVEWLLTSTNAAKDVRLFGLTGYLTQRYRDFKAEHLSINQQIVLSCERAMFRVSLLSILGTLIAWGLATAQAMAGAISVGGLAAVFQSVQQLGRTFDTLSDQIGHLSSNNPFLSDYFAFLSMDAASIEGTLSTPSTCTTVARAPARLQRYTLRACDVQVPGVR